LASAPTAGSHTGNCSYRMSCRSDIWSLGCVLLEVRLCLSVLPQP
jgi:serine/threonine protein kinase